jgi:hypothetical protein
MLARESTCTIAVPSFSAVHENLFYGFCDYVNVLEMDINTTEELIFCHMFALQGIDGN